MTFADGYVSVSERLEAFYKKYPDGSIQSDIVELTESRVVIKAFAYRKPDDPRPGIGHSQLGIPGKTNFTRGSELENAETSAWGRAIAALGFDVKGGVASKDEVDNKSDEPYGGPGQARSAAADMDTLADLRSQMAMVELDGRWIIAVLDCAPNNAAVNRATLAWLAAEEGRTIQQLVSLATAKRDTAAEKVTP